MMADGPFGVLRVLRRLHCARKTMRAWASCQRSCCHGTLTTFPAIAAYRELARTGDVEAFAAKDLRPVTRPIASLVGDAEAVMEAARRARAAAEEVSEMLKERARTIVITPPDAAIKATVLVLTDEERRGLTTDLNELGPVK